jgi:hypothetical protein
MAVGIKEHIRYVKNALKRALIGYKALSIIR